MTEPSHPPTRPERFIHSLPGGETIEIDGSTVPDPETSRPTPAAVLRLPVWRLRELSTALNSWTGVLTTVTASMHLPAEDDLARALGDTARALARP